MARLQGLLCFPMPRASKQRAITGFGHSVNGRDEAFVDDENLFSQYSDICNFLVLYFARTVIIKLSWAILNDNDIILRGYVLGLGCCLL